MPERRRSKLKACSRNPASAQQANLQFADALFLSLPHCKDGKAYKAKAFALIIRNSESLPAKSQIG